MARYKVFTRTWWKLNSKWPDGREPHAGRKHVIGHALSEEGAREWCKRYNDMHEPGRLSKKAEYEEV